MKRGHFKDIIIARVVKLSHSTLAFVSNTLVITLCLAFVPIMLVCPCPMPMPMKYVGTNPIK